MRSTERQRQRAVERLQAAYLEGALSTGTFEARAISAFDGRTTKDLSRLLDDVPTQLERLLGRVRLFFWPELEGAVPRDFRDVALPRRVGSIVVGRDPGCDVVLAHLSVSRRHLRISFDGAQWTVQDLRSTNGSWLGGRRCRVSLARPGEHVRLGEVELRLV